MEENSCPTVAYVAGEPLKVNVAVAVPLAVLVPAQTVHP